MLNEAFFSFRGESAHLHIYSLAFFSYRSSLGQIPSRLDLNLSREKVEYPRSTLSSYEKKFSPHLMWEGNLGSCRKSSVIVLAGIGV